jgi:hypothetical protein
MLIFPKDQSHGRYGIYIELEPKRMDELVVVKHLSLYHYLFKFVVFYFPIKQ